MIIGVVIQINTQIIYYINQIGTHAFDCHFQMCKSTFLKPAGGGGPNLVVVHVKKLSLWSFTVPP